MADGRQFWFDVIESLAVEAMNGLPIFMIVSVAAGLGKEFSLDPLHSDISASESRGVLTRYPLRPVASSDFTAWAGDADDRVVEQLLAASDRRVEWADALWHDWVEGGVVGRSTDVGAWRFVDTGVATPSITDVIDKRLAELLAARGQSQQFRPARLLLACAALEGEEFTAEAAALVARWDPDAAIDLLDDVVSGGFGASTGLVDEAPAIRVNYGGDEVIRWRYRFDASSYSSALAMFGLTPAERLRYAERYTHVLQRLFPDPPGAVAFSLSTLSSRVGKHRQATTWARRASFTADRSIVRERVRYRMESDRTGWDRTEYAACLSELMNAGETLRFSDPASNVMAIYEDALKIARCYELSSDAGSALFAIADLLYTSGGVDDALRIGAQARQAAVESRDEDLTFSAVALMAEAHLSRGDIGAAESYISEAERIAPNWSARRNATWLRLLMMMDERRGSERTHRSVIEFLAESVRVDGSTRSLMIQGVELAKYELVRGWLEQARAHLMWVESLDPAKEFPSVQDSVNLYLGRLDTLAGRYESAERRLLESLFETRRSGRRWKEGVIWGWLGLLAKRRGDHKTALIALCIAAPLIGRRGWLAGSAARTVVAAEFRGDGLPVRQLIDELRDAYRADDGARFALAIRDNDWPREDGYVRMAARLVGG
jgi:tetratricopeptide (TPR) repeat protein